MSWLGALAGKAEDLLNKMDKSAAVVLHHPDDEMSATNSNPGRPKPPSEFTWDSNKTPGDYSPFLSVDKTSSMTSSASVPSNLNDLEANKANGASSQMSKSMLTSGTVESTSRLNKKKDQDEALFEFLNSVETTSSSGNKLKAKSASNGRHSRQSSGTSTPVSRGARTPDVPGGKGLSDVAVSGSPPQMQETVEQVDTSFIEIDCEPAAVASEDLNRDSTDSATPSTNSSSHPTEEDAEALLNGHADSSSGYHSSGDEASSRHEHLSSLELENKLLRQEVESLNQEMQSVIQRAQSANEELKQARDHLDKHTHQLAQTDQRLREVLSREGDVSEALTVKDSQLAILRVRLEESDKKLEHYNKQLQGIEMEKERILQDHTSASGVQGQALDSLKEKLNDVEASLRQERDNNQKAQADMQIRQNQLEGQYQSVSEELSVAQKKHHEEKGRLNMLTGQLKSSKAQVDIVKQELTEYKEKATRILQSKDKLIASLKEGGGGPAGGEGLVSLAELEDMKQERDLTREESHRLQLTLDNLRQELAEVELQAQQDNQGAEEHLASLEDQLMVETKRREESDVECTRQKQELRFAHEEIIKQKSGFQSRLQDRENEIERLRNQLTTKSMSSASQAELENRLRALTESLIEKQTVLEALSTEKHSLGMQLERLEKQYHEAEASALRASSTTVHMNEDDEVRHRVPNFMRESPLDGDMTRRVKRAANSIDKFSVRLGIFLRRYPIARVFVIMYMILLHVWVMIVLLTYKPEMHDSTSLPKPPSV